MLNRYYVASDYLYPGQETYCILLTYLLHIQDLEAVFPYLDVPICFCCRRDTDYYPAAYSLSDFDDKNASLVRVDYEKTSANLLSTYTQFIRLFFPCV